MNFMDSPVQSSWTVQSSRDLVELVDPIIFTRRCWGSWAACDHYLWFVLRKKKAPVTVGNECGRDVVPVLVACVFVSALLAVA